jgi:hypothetical protein
MPSALFSRRERISDAILGADGADADDDRRLSAHDLVREHHQRYALFGRSGVVFAGRAANGDCIDAGADKVFDPGLTSK